MGRIEVEGLSKRFGRLRAVDRVTLEVAQGEFLTILGPSGSGKSTLLRLVAGLEAPDEGRIVLDKEVVCGPAVWRPPQQRDIGMVFQNFALWPHMTAAENVAFPLEMAGRKRDEITRRVGEVMEMVELHRLAAKRPAELSGGEQQRVALARAVVGRPSILLMDECLSNLDARLREKMANEMHAIQRSVGITTLYVTHDPQEALALSDRLAVLHQGRLLQIGSPAELYHRPGTSMVASALGAVNLLPVQQLRHLGLPLPTGAATILGLRPEQVPIVACREALPEGHARVAGRVLKSTFMGDSEQYSIDLGGLTIQARRPLGNGTAPLGLRPGQEAWLLLEPDRWMVLDGRAPDAGDTQGPDRPLAVGTDFEPTENGWSMDR